MTETSDSRGNDRQSQRNEKREMSALRRQAGLGGMNERMMELSVSPPRQRRDQSPWRIMTPPPPNTQATTVMSGKGMPGNALMTPAHPMPPPEAPRGGAIMRNHSSPSLVDTSPKVSREDTSGSRKSPPRTQVLDSPAVRQRRPTPRTNTGTSAFRLPAAAELTPVTDNTSAEFVENAQGMVVSPDDTAMLQGEHLTLPSRRDLKPRPSTSARGPPLPPLPTAERSKSVPSLEQAFGAYNYENEVEVQNDVHGEEEQQQASIPSVQFPSRRQFYSFQSQRSYEQQHGVLLPSTVQPYQPTRDDLVVGIGADSVHQIFQPALPMEERQFSTPSIRMANQLNGSTTSYTDEEDVLVGAYEEEDDISLSSRGSSLYLPEEEAVGSAVLKLGGVSTFPNPVPPVVMGDAYPEAQVQWSDEADDEKDELDDVHKVARHKKRTKKNNKERKAYEWLRTVERAGPDVIAEAASSRFLTGGHRTSPQPAFVPRTESSPSPTLPASGTA